VSSCVFALCAVVLVACSAEPLPLAWGLRFASPADQARAVWAEAAIHTGSCTGPVVFSEEILVSAGAGMARPALLGPGRYALTGRARDASCAWFAAGCLELDLPTTGSAIVELASSSETAQCPPSACSDGTCAGMDAGLVDAGSVDGGALDASQFDAEALDAAALDEGPAFDAAALDEGPAFDGGADACVIGVGGCACPPPLVVDATGTGCLDLSRDSNNCGTRGFWCGRTTMCAGGVCVCRPGLTARTVGGTTCLALQSDANNCGVRDNRCAGPQVCSRGACSPVCASGLRNCAEDCVDVQTDIDNCGACGATCNHLQVCVAGVCRAYAPALLCTSCTGCTACAGTTSCCPYATSGPFCVADTGGACP
jgi:hypothetical protein